MDATLHQLADLLIEAIPTILFFILLTVFLKRFYFKPVARILEERRRATEGARELARQAFEAADQKSSEFDRALQLARNQLHQENEALRREWENGQAEQLGKARAEAESRVQQARGEIAAEVEQVRSQLGGQVESLSERIVAAVSSRRAA